MFRPRRLTPRCSLAFVSIPKACSKLQDEALISVKNTSKPSDADASAGKVPSATFGLFVNSSTVEAKNLTVWVWSL